MKTRAFLLSILVLLGLQGSTVGTQQQTPPINRPFVTGELLISYEPWATETTRAQARNRLRAGLKRALRNSPDGRLELAALPAGMSVQEAIDALSNAAGVQYAEPNWLYTRDATSNDPSFTNGSLWGMLGDASTPANQFGSQAAEAWTAGFTGSHNVYVAVIDEGIDFNHPDLAGNIFTNPFDPPDGIDNDGNGFIDDVHGWDFFSHNNSVFDGTPGSGIDEHGTHVAGTIGATGGNAIGVVGVNWDVTIIPLKFLGPNGGSTADAVAALDYITDMKLRHGLNIVATNNSWGGGGFSQALLDAITRAAKADILFVAAAGNSNRNNDAIASYPSNYNTTQGSSTETAASYDAVIAVASITSSGARSSFSSYGRTTVDLGAPGNGILSTTPFNTYSGFSGTSMAAPHVTGAVALYASMQPATAAQIKQAILASAAATPTASLATVTATGGRLNIGHFLAGSTPPPAAPTGLSATAASTSQINLAWTDASIDETGFSIQRCTGAACTAFAEIATVGANVATYQNTGLSASTTFRYRVVAFNGGGSSTPSNIASATTLTGATVPNAPASLAATVISATQINLSWTDQSTNETGFRVERCTGAGCVNFSAIASLGTNAASYSSTGLAPSTTYRYRVFAFNAVGDSGASNIVSATTTATPTVPAAPSGLAATAVSSGQINLAWTDAAANETGFRIERCTGATCVDFSAIASLGPNATSYSSTGLAPGTTYRYRAFAFNAVGDSTASNIAQATTSAASSIPAAPSGLAATFGPGAGQATLSWVDNSNNETGFRAFIVSCTGGTCTEPALVAEVGADVTTVVVTIPPGGPWSYSVRSFNAAGVSRPSNGATPR